MTFTIAKPLRDFLIKEGVYEKAIKYAEIRNSHLLEPYNGTFTFLAAMFVFANTMEGAMYWQKLSDKQKDF